MLILATLLIGLIPAILKGIPGISPNLQQVIADISASVAAVLGAGVINQPSMNTIMAAWLGVVTALKADPALPPDSLNSVLQLEKIVQAVLAQDAELAKSVDWTKIHPIALVA